MKKELIYNVLNGYCEQESIFLSNDIPVEDEFEGDKECARLYKCVYQARCRLAEKLGSDEDEDIEEIINKMNEIARILAFKMYEYGRAEGSELAGIEM